MISINEGLEIIKEPGGSFIIIEEDTVNNDEHQV